MNKMNKGYKIKDIGDCHNKIEIWNEMAEKNVKVDDGISDLIVEIWKAKIYTILECENDDYCRALYYNAESEVINIEFLHCMDFEIFIFAMTNGSDNKDGIFQWLSHEVEHKNIDDKQKLIHSVHFLKQYKPFVLDKLKNHNSNGNTHIEKPYKNNYPIPNFNEHPSLKILSDIFHYNDIDIVDIKFEKKDIKNHKFVDRIVLVSQNMTDIKKISKVIMNNIDFESPLYNRITQKDNDINNWYYNSIIENDISNSFVSYSLSFPVSDSCDIVEIFDKFGKFGTQLNDDRLNNV